MKHDYEKGDHIVIDDQMPGTFIRESPAGYAEFMMGHRTMEEAHVNHPIRETLLVVKLHRIEHHHKE